MSDGLTDANRDMKRAERLNVWLDTLLGYLEGSKSAEDVQNAADDVAGVRRGLTTGPLPSFRQHSDRMVSELAAGSEKAWREFVANTEEAPPDIQDRRDELRKKFERDDEGVQTSTG